MANLDKNIEGGASVGRVIWLDPNKANNVMVNPEDLSINVDFRTTRKGRTLIFSGEEITSTENSSSSIGFIEGSKKNDKSEERSLTTRYTNAISLDLINPSNIDNQQSGSNDDYESLGIESIDIEFNTAYTPIIKIKFIDVRGNAILNQGNSSKYKMFFELPYPLFRLKVKGFYGKAVTYCLHLQRWNANFNSETGNFEIQADFIGYTYAFLTDMIIGLVRAASFTERGKKKLEEKRNQYKENKRDLVITIDEMLKNILLFNNNFNKIREENDSVKKIGTFSDVFDKIEKIKQNIVDFMNEMGGDNPPFKNEQILVVDSKIGEEKDDLFNNLKEIIVANIKTINDDENIPQDLKINNKIIDLILKTTKIIKEKLEESASNSNTTFAIKTSGYRLTPAWSSTTIEAVNNILEQIKLGSTISNATEFNVYTFKYLLDELDTKSNLMTEERDDATENLITDLSNSAETQLGFEPTIRNIFRVLTINTEVFLEILRDVSVASQSNSVRKKEIKKLFGDNQPSLNIPKKDIDADAIYAWPEYREKDKNGDYVETYMGANKNVTIENIDELVFTEEMLKGFIDVVKSEDELSRLDDLLNAGLDIDSIENEIKNKWWPISTADLPLGNPNINNNPYLTALEENPSGSEYEIIRVLFYRIFLLSSSYLNGKIPENLLTIHAKLEVENVISALKKIGGKNSKEIASLLSNKTVEDIINIGKEGSDKLSINNKKKPFFIEKLTQMYGIFSDPLISFLAEPKVTSVQTEFLYYYDYITSETTKNHYIPINKGFSGTQFFDSNKFKNTDRLNTLTQSGFEYMSNPVNILNGFFVNKNDNSYLFDIIESNIYASNIKNLTPALISDKTIESVDKFIKKNSDNVIDITKNALLTLNYPTKNIDDDTNETFYNTGLSPFIQEDYPVNQVTALPLFYYENTNNLISDDIISGTYIVKLNSETKQNINLGGTYLLGTETLKTAIKNFKIGEINNGDLLLPKIGSELTPPLYKDGFGVRNWYIDNGYLLNQNNLLNDDSKDYFIPFIEFGSALHTKFKDSNNVNFEPKLRQTSGKQKLRLIKQSLFGSWLYNQQKFKEAKAILFLHTIPFNGVNMLANGEDITSNYFFDKSSDYFIESKDDSTQLLSKVIFQSINGLIPVPKPWLLFIGGILWRLEQKEEPIIFNDIYSNNKFNTLINDEFLPKKDEYLFYYGEHSNKKFDDGNGNPWGMYFDGFTEPKKKSGIIINNSYIPIDKTLKYLPKVVKEKIINYFLSWVNDTNGFIKIQEELEIWDGFDKGDATNEIDKTDEYIGKLNMFTTKLQKHTSTGDNPTLDIDKIKVSDLDSIFNSNATKNYDFIYVNTENVGQGKGQIGSVQLILKPETEIQSILINLFTEPVFLKNNNPNIWNSASSKEKIIGLDKNEALISQGFKLNDSGLIRPGKDIYIRKSQFEKFIKTFKTHFDELNKDLQSEKTVENTKEKQRIFGSTDDDSIKLQIYRTLSSINDKWVNGSNTGCAMQMCGENNLSDKELAKEYRNISDGCPSLLDTFRFVDRAFRDIGDDFYLHLNYINEIIIGNYNQSFFDVVNQILTNNNFNFITLPTFFNFNDIDQLKSAFTPYSYVDVENIRGNGGPAFVCVYVGQSSKNLDLGTDSPYPDDGLSFNYDKTEGLKIQDEASDFSIVAGKGEFNVPVFAVNYGQQNQNYFKSLKLDQREFAETMESLQVIEQISNGGDKSKSSYAGNNLFNVYQTRSYSATVEMMGSAMIQPMMYFQLNNVPMFRGAYLIYKTTHSIKPHSMTTTVTGSRVKKTKTPLLDKATVYMNLVGLDTPPGFSGGSRVPKGASAPILRTLLENGASSSNIDASQISSCEVPDIPGIKFIGVSSKKMICEAVEPLTEMLKDWVQWMKDEKFKGQNDGAVYAYVTSLFRTGGGSNSMHNFGLAVDLQFFKKNGEIIPNRAKNGGRYSEPEYFSFEEKNNPALKWLYNHAYEYGFAQPYWANDGKNTTKDDGEEHWHWEYHGKSAICILRKQPIPGLGNNSSNDNPLSEIKDSKIKSFVKNPKNPDGSEAVYADCDYKPYSDGPPETTCDKLSNGIVKINEEKLKNDKKNALNNLGKV